MAKKQGETESSQDTPQEVGLSSADDKGTSAERTYTEAELKKAISDAEALKGRDWKAQTERADKAEKRAELAETQISEQAERVLEVQNRLDQVELDQVRDNPDALGSYQEKQALRKLQAELAEERRKLQRDKTEHSDALKQLETHRREQDASRIASKHGVDATVLLAVTDGTEEKMEALAKVLPKLSPAGETKKEEEAAWTPAPGATSGGRRSLRTMTPEQIDKLSMEEYKELRAKEGM